MKKNKKAAKQSPTKSINRNVNIRSKKSDIELEIIQLKAYIESTEEIDTVNTKKRIIMLETELTHRISGHKRPVRILQGGAAGSKK